MGKPFCMLKFLRVQLVLPSLGESMGGTKHGLWTDSIRFNLSLVSVLGPHALSAPHRSSLENEDNRRTHEGLRTQNVLIFMKCLEMDLAQSRFFRSIRKKIRC